MSIVEREDANTNILSFIVGTQRESGRKSPKNECHSGRGFFCVNHWRGTPVGNGESPTGIRI